MRSRTGFGLRVVVGASVAVAVALTVATGGLANAATTGDTTVTFTVSAAGGLAITVPASKLLTSVAPGASTSGQLGAVTVTDARALLAPTWAASVSSTAFTTGTATTPETIPNTAVSYWSGATTAATSGMTYVPGQPLVTDAVVLSSGQTAMSLTAGSGSNSAAWNPTLIVAAPASAVGGLYTGTVTHSVA
jgi:hypothetical protein